MTIDVDLGDRAAEAYERAYECVVQARQEWEAAGRPFILEQRNRMVGVHPIWKALREPILTQKALELLESRGNYRYIDVGPSGTMATFTKYNLAPGSTSVAFPILTPFGHDAQNLQRLLA